MNIMIKVFFINKYILDNITYARDLLLHRTAGRDHVDAEAIKAIGMHDKQHEVFRSSLLVSLMRWVLYKVLR